MRIEGARRIGSEKTYCWRLFRIGRLRLDLDISWIALPLAVDLDSFSPGIHVGPFCLTWFMKGEW